MLRASPAISRLITASTLGVLLLGAAPAATAKEQAPAKLERVLAKEKALLGDAKRLRLRENIEGLAAAFRDLADEGSEADRREAAEGELRALRLLAHWSGTASDKKRAAEAEANLKAKDKAKPVEEAEAAPKKTKNAEEAEAKVKPKAAEPKGAEPSELDRALARAAAQRPVLERVEVEPSAEGVDLLLPVLPDLKARREVLGDRRSPRVYFDLSPLVAAKDALTTIAVDHALVRRIRVGQLDAKTVRVVFDLAPGRAFPKTMAFVAGASPRLSINDGGPAISAMNPPAGATAPTAPAPKLAAATKVPAKALAPPPAVETSSAAADPLAALIEIQSALDEAWPAIGGVNSAAGASLEASAKPRERARKQVEEPAEESPVELSIDRSALSAKDRPGSVLQIRRVVVDAGHGGKDSGAVGKRGTKEKDVNLAIAMAVGRALERRLGVEVVYTRTKDVYVSLEKRVQVANASEGDLFISVHSNAHRNRKFAGIETYYLNTTANRYANRLAARENAAEWSDAHLDAGDPGERVADDDVGALPGGAIGQDLRLLLADLAMRSATEKSRRLATLVQASLVGQLKRTFGEVVDLGVKHALFYVLLGSRMPSILIESGFLSHPDEERRLADPVYQRSVADSIVGGIERFVAERNQIASRM